MVLVLTGRTVTTRWRKSTAAAGPMPPRTPNAAEGGGYGEPTPVMKSLQVQHVEFVGEHNFSVVDGADLLQGSLLGLPAFQPWAAMNEYELLDLGVSCHTSGTHRAALATVLHAGFHCRLMVPAHVQHRSGTAGELDH